MSLDDRRQGWPDRNGSVADQRFAALAGDVLSRSARFEASRLRRDWIEALAAIIVLTCLGVFLWFSASTPVMTLGVVIIMYSAFEIIVVLVWTRHRDSRPRPEASMLEFSSAEMARLDRQIRLLRNVFWWYSAPLLVGIAVFLGGVLWGVPDLPGLTSFGFHAGFFLCLALVANIIHRANQRTVNSELLPLREQLAAFRRDLATPSTDADRDPSEL